MILISNWAYPASGSQFRNSKTLTENCVREGIPRKHNERFESGCNAACECQNGNIGCVSMCPPHTISSSCKRSKQAGACCGTVRCSEAMVNS